MITRGSWSFDEDSGIIYCQKYSAEPGIATVTGHPQFSPIRNQDEILSNGRAIRGIPVAVSELTFIRKLVMTKPVDGIRVSEIYRGVTNALLAMGVLTEEDLIKESK